MKIIILVVYYFLLVPKVFADFSLIPKGWNRTTDADNKPVSHESGCDFQTGEMTFACIPNYIQYLITIIVELAGTIAVIFIMVGGFKYIFSGISEDKEAGKETIKNALLGLVITGLAWIIVTWIISLVTM